MIPTRQESRRSQESALSSRVFLCTISAILSLSYWSVHVEAFQVAILPSIIKIPSQLSSSSSSSSVLFSSTKKPHDIVDAEFEVSTDTDDSSPPLPPSDDDNSDQHQSLLDLSLNSGDPRWKQARIPFVDTVSQTAIEGTLSFLVTVDGIEYGIATPCDAAAAITSEDTDGTVTYLHPDDDDNAELMEIMAAQLVEHVGADLSLKRTPRVLTITGDLDKYTQNFADEILPPPHPTRTLLEDDDDETESWFHEFMRAELGEEEYQKTMNEPATAESIGDELMELFDVAGMGERSDDVAGMEAMIQDLLDEVDPLESVGIKEEDQNPHDALKLVSYHFGKGRAYSLVRLLKPYTLVGRLVQTDNNNISSDDQEENFHFELMTKEEEKLVIPKVEQVCMKELESAGLDLAP
ncbi:expressed unknown protein [Seminavis robusta]|uniref:Uncharacterized protein n=1 Tax=Seminavis robusta TaxID=568900 RepID=A0A9N8H4I0_9STRA|nr:expressed unknown protein [Seminavis robusta]|eukprot:Sro50_g029030.1 n/a (408) ;mRNA; f:60544-61767